jgi:hypothetical protein
MRADHADILQSYIVQTFAELWIFSPVIILK